MTDELPIIPFESEQAWEQWLDDQHETAPGLWLKIAKKDSGIETISYQQALTVALCFGWIDGQKKKFDERYWLQKFTPRRPKSKWSQINRDKATALIEQGVMREAGLREVERARQDGRWDAAYAPPSQITMPDDFQQMLDQHPEALAFFEALNRTNRYAILSHIHDAKRPETRQRRITKYLDMLKREEKLYD